MTDIVERLRALAAIDGCQASIDAADEITRLRADNLRLRAALEELLACPHVADRDIDPAWIEPETEAAVEAARAALEDHFAGVGKMIESPPAPSSWRPIETAPKDGTEVLMVFVFEDGEVLHRVVWWDNSNVWPWRNEYTGLREQDAKAWMPLSPPPDHFADAGKMIASHCPYETEK